MNAPKVRSSSLYRKDYKWYLIALLNSYNGIKIRGQEYPDCANTLSRLLTVCQHATVKISSVSDSPLHPCASIYFKDGLFRIRLIREENIQTTLLLLS